MKKLVVFLACFLVFILSSLAQVEFLSENTVAAFYFSGLKSWQESSSPAWNDPEIQDCLDMFQGIANSLWQRIPMPQDQREEVKKILQLFQGNMIASVYINKTGNLAPLWILGDGERAWQIVPWLLEKYVGAGIKDITLAGDIKAKEIKIPAGSLFMMMHQAYCVISNTKASLEEYVATEKTLGESKHFCTMLDMIGNTNKAKTILGYVNTEKIFQVALDRTQKSREMGFAIIEADQIIFRLKELGIQNLKGCVFHLVRDVESQSDMVIWYEGNPKGIFEVLDLSGGNPQNITQLVRGEVAQFSYIHLDFLKIWQCGMELVKNLDPDIHKQILSQLSTLESKTSWNLEKDILQPISGEILSFGMKGKMANAPFLCIQLRNSQQFFRSIERACNKIELEPHMIEYAGNKIYYFTLPVGDLNKTISEGYTPSMPGFIQYYINAYLQYNLCFFIKNDVLILSNLVQNLKDYIDLENTPSTLPVNITAGTPIVFWSGDSSAAVYWYNTFLPIFSVLESPLREMGLAWDNSRLPSASSIQKLCGPMQAITAATGKGFKISFSSKNELMPSPMILVGLLGVGLSVTVPMLDIAREKAKIIISVNKLKILHQASMQYEMKFGKFPSLKNPDFFIALYEKKCLEKDTLVFQRPPATDADIKAKKRNITDYEVCIKPIAKTANMSTTMFLWSKKGLHGNTRVVLFYDGHVETMEEEAFLAKKD